MAMLTLKKVNDALAAAGAAEVLFKGRDYYYFGEGDTHRWPETSVMVSRLNHLSLESWVDEWRRLKQLAAEHNGEDPEQAMVSGDSVELAGPVPASRKTFRILGGN